MERDPFDVGDDPVIHYIQDKFLFQGKWNTAVDSAAGLKQRDKLRLDGVME